VLIVSVVTETVPRIPDSERVSIEDLGAGDDGIIGVVARYGYLEQVNVPNALRLLDPADTNGPIELDKATYFLSRVQLTQGDQPTMAAWRKRLFIATTVLSSDAAGRFGLPQDRTVIVGSRLQV